MRWNVATAGAASLAALLAAGCGGGGQPAATPVVTVPAVQSGSPPGTAAPVEVSPQGDISDQIAYVPWTSGDGRVRFTHPEGWSQTPVAGGVRFAEKLDSVTVTAAAGAAPSVGQVTADVVPVLRAAGTAVQIESVAAVSLSAGPAVRVTWRVNSAPDPVTTKVHRDEVVTFVVGGPGGRTARMDLAGPVGSDNVDPYRIMSQSLVLT